ncbi:unnamed protein product [Lactuca saligna]|uniref:Uncharacterized protein n=1 Tax=Lactuca saligna TaxID=75948 RepID=A0AA36EE13_LACSI|nr:unnamed protein product [Lactuca saligna]
MAITRLCGERGDGGGGCRFVRQGIKCGEELKRMMEGEQTIVQNVGRRRNSRKHVVDCCSLESDFGLVRVVEKLGDGWWLAFNKSLSYFYSKSELKKEDAYSLLPPDSVSATFALHFFLLHRRHSFSDLNHPPPPSASDADADPQKCSATFPLHICFTPPSANTPPPTGHLLRQHRQRFHPAPSNSSSAAIKLSYHHNSNFVASFTTTNIQNSKL